MCELITPAVKTPLLNDNKRHLVREGENLLTRETGREIKYGSHTLLYSDIENEAFCTFKKQKCHVKQTKITVFFLIRLGLQGIKYLQFLLKQKGT